MSNRAKIKNLDFVGLFARTTLFMESLMPLGKYKGETVEDVISIDPDYLDWFESNVDSYTYDQAVIKVLNNTPRSEGAGEESEVDFLEDPGTLLCRAFGHRR